MERKRISLITIALEKRFGVPDWKGPSDPLDSLVKTVLSQNTNDLNRDRAYESLRKIYPTWEKVMRARTENIAKAIRVGGLANQKSERIKAILVWLKNEYDDLSLDAICDMDFDETYERFGHLKGIGVKTLAVVLMFACGQDVFPVDTHVHRLCRRLGLVHENVAADKTFELMRGNVPKGKAYSLHMNMLTLGRTICHAGKPKCNDCPILKYCPFGQEKNKNP